jgi:predicted AlkP superfamily pyrophosphatase or phosphodiesterase
MKRLLALILLTTSLAVAADTKPRLVLVIVVDQFRYDYLTRFRTEYKGGLARLLKDGAVFTNARYEHFPTVTAIGHATILTGATPSISGIVGNDWYDRDSGKQVTSVSDPSCKILGGSGEGGASPNRLLVSTLGDELKIATNGKSKVVGISLKDRAAILPAGHSANAAYWFDARAGKFVSSTWYMNQLPAWVESFNAVEAGKYRGAEWLNHKLPANDRAFAAMAGSPFGNDIVETFAERAIGAEALGKGPGTDVLTVSYSANDYVGHEYGPDSPEVREVSLRTDALLDRFFRYVDSKVGLQNVLVVFTADHGVAPLPEVNAARHMPGGRMPAGIIQNTVQTELVRKYGEGNWIVSPSEHSLYFNDALIQDKKLNLNEVADTAKEALLKVPHVFRVYTRQQLMDGHTLEDQIGRRVMNGFYVRRGADIYVLLEPYWMFGKSGTTHGTTFSYDSHVPVIFMGAWVKSGRYNNTIAVNDIAPTLATILDIETPSGSVGRALSEILVR